MENNEKHMRISKMMLTCMGEGTPYLRMLYRSTIAGLSKNNSKNKNVKIRKF